ncbi:TetR/AcrR family transcriptional regulator [Phenylobacterium sp.]|uniref:TetR/AcrR family transcriptional regulator n=1 Tax=Phenylobacterium sp. TaxID=1871053 RepID=UPI0012091522|nr:TetR/AcrR family transcriptional regulator [Phenylobacterium sp.]THD60820.1 MAG: TetR/AcrR family transcriptional regulator [Phenylobacterium sp.]
MPVADRRRRERANRHDLILAAARNLAEAEGWEAVTTRRLAELVEYSQPVLYSHFAGKDAIVRAVAIEGFADLAAILREARLSADDPQLALRAICSAYLNFAAERPALYQAMFVMPTDVKFASEDTPQPLKAGFGEFVCALGPFDRHPDLRAEVTWAALHGLAVLRRGGRIPPERQEERIDLLVSQVVNDRRD